MTTGAVAERGRRGVRSVRSVAAVGASLLAACLIAGSLSACTGSPAPPAPSDVTITSTVVSTRPAPPVFTPAPASTVAPLPPEQAPAPGEVERLCPYISSTPAENPAVNVADIEGDHVYRTTVLTTMKPVGCRFYFYAGPFEAVADITTRTFPTALAAHNAMVLTGEAGQGAQGIKDLVPGVDAVLFQTRFFGPDGTTDWACVFAKGRVMVTVHTQQTDVSFNVRQLATAVAPKI